MIARGALINLMTRSLAVVLGLAITIIVARMGAQSQGTFALFMAVESTVLALFSGFGIALARRISYHGEYPAGLITSVVFACMFVGVLVGIAVMGLSFLSDSYSSLWILACGAPLMLIGNNLSGVYLGQGRMLPMAGLQLGTPLLVLLMALAYMVGISALTVAVILWSWVFARAIVGLASLVVLRRTSGIGQPDRQALYNVLPFVGLIGVTNLISLLNYKIDLFLVEYYMGLASVGVYSIAIMTAELLWFVSSSVTTAAFSRIGTSNSREAGRLVVKVMHFSLLTLALMSPLVWLGAALLLPLLLGLEYARALPMLAVLLPGVVAFGAASALSAYFTNHFGRPMISALLAGLSLVINAAVSVVLIPRWGPIGGAVATSVSYLASVTISMALFVHMSGVPLSALMRPDWKGIRADLARVLTSIPRSGTC